LGRRHGRVRQARLAQAKIAAGQNGGDFLNNRIRRVSMNVHAHLPLSFGGSVLNKKAENV
jgi:hypothetical protein